MPFKLFFGNQTAGGAPVTHYTLEALSGAVTLAGSNVTLRAGRVAAVAAGAITLAGPSTTLRAARKAVTTAGAVVLAGQNVTLTYTPVIAGHFTLTALPGGIVLAGEPILLTVGTVEHYTMTAGTGDIYFSRISAGLQGPTVQPGPLRFGHARVYLNRW